VSLLKDKLKSLNILTHQFDKEQEIEANEDDDQDTTDQ